MTQLRPDGPQIGGAYFWYGPTPEPGVGSETAAAPAATRPARRLGGLAGSVRFSAAVARRLCLRVESGESLRAICADPDMPHRSTVRDWMRQAPAFRKAIERARSAAGWHFGPGRRPLWNDQTAREVCMRVAAGEALSKVCDDPDLPSVAVVYKWRSERPEFNAQLRLAREVAAERLCDQGWEIACAVTPEDAYAVRVKLAQLRWMTSYLAPRRFGRFKAVEAEVALEEAAEAAVLARPSAVLMKKFMVEQRADGAHRVVMFAPDPVTNTMVRMSPEDEPWSPAPPGRWRPPREG